MLAADQTYSILFDLLSTMMASMDRGHAAGLAAELTNRVNLRILDPLIILESKFSKSIERQIHAVLPDQLMNYATLCLPWNAFRSVHGTRGAAGEGRARPARLVCSLPEALDAALRNMSTGSLRSGSLLDTMGSLICDAKHHIILINPYWSFIGIKALMRRLTRASFAEVEMFILTQPKNSLSLEERHSLQLLVGEMENRGAKCTVLAPIYSGTSTPLLHAKAMVVDDQRAYLGSANITGNGMNFSVELGMEFEGDLARQLGEWLQFIAQQMQEL